MCPEIYLSPFSWIHSCIGFLCDQVTVKLENGQSYEGDLLIGADGIRSKVISHKFPKICALYINIFILGNLPFIGR